MVKEASLVKEMGQGAAGHKEIERESIMATANYSYWSLHQLDHRHKLLVSRVETTSPTKRPRTIDGSQPDERKTKRFARGSRSRRFRGFFCSAIML